MYDIFFHTAVKKDIKKIPKDELEKIKRVIDVKLKYKPLLYSYPLRATLKKYFKLRVGNYRVVFEFKSKQVFILAIIHRKDVYKISNKRIK